MKVIAILDRSAGNDSVGEMWQETHSFDQHDMLATVLRWATRQTSENKTAAEFRGNLRLTIDQGSLNE